MILEIIYSILKNPTARAGVKNGLRGVGNICNANEIVKKSNEKYEGAAKHFEEQRDLTNNSLKEFENQKKNIKYAFETFSKNFEKIKNKPYIKYEDKEIKLDEIELYKIKKVLIDGVDLAAGFVLIAAVPVAQFIAGGILRAKGNETLEKARQIEEQHKKAIKEMNEISGSFLKLRLSIDKLNRELKTLYNLYLKQACDFEKLVSTNIDYSTYSQEEKYMVENNIMLIILMKDVFKIRIEANNSRVTIKEEEVDEWIDKSKKLKGDRKI